MKLLLWMTVIAFSILSYGCGGSEQGVNKSNGSTNAPSANPANVNNNTSASQTDTGFPLPSPKPIENGKKQTHTGITITVPADWKAIGKEYLDDGVAGNPSGRGFQSPGDASEAIKVFVGRSYEAQTGDMVTEFIKLRKEQPDGKFQMPGVDGIPGILTLAEKDCYFVWTTFQPPVNGYTVKRYIRFACPAGTYEQNKQQMVDILYSAKIEN